MIHPFQAYDKGHISRARLNPKDTQWGPAHLMEMKISHCEDDANQARDGSKG